MKLELNKNNNNEHFEQLNYNCLMVTFPTEINYSLLQSVSQCGQLQRTLFSGPDRFKNLKEAIKRCGSQVF